MADKGLSRFLEAQNQLYLTALSEIKNGSKQSHWMWFIFPQLKGLGRSENASYFGIDGRKEAVCYLEHPVLGKHLIEISQALMQVDGKTANQIFGAPDDMKLRSCMTLFAALEHTHPVFGQVLEKYFEGKTDNLTLELLETES
jgi:uncharacterized protein (DUF1810 family)